MISNVPQVDAYNVRADQQGLMPEEMRAIRILLQEEEAPELGGIKFDVIFVRLRLLQCALPTDCLRKVCSVVSPSP